MFYKFKSTVFLINGIDMAKKTVLLRLESTAGTGYFYVKNKNPKKLTKKLEFMKFDPKAKKHVLFVEKKMK